MANVNIPLYIIVILIAIGAFIVGIVVGMAIADAWWRKHAVNYAKLQGYTRNKKEINSDE